MDRKEFETLNETNLEKDFPKGSKVLYWTDLNNKPVFPNEHEQKFEELESIQDDGLVVLREDGKGTTKVSYDQLVGIEDLEGMLHCFEDEDDEDHE